VLQVFSSIQAQNRVYTHCRTPGEALPATSPADAKWWRESENSGTKAPSILPIFAHAKLRNREAGWQPEAIWESGAEY
jgi:hypothetical protein